MTSKDWLVSRPIAHRGLHARAAGVIENSRSAFAAAIEGGFGIECDVQLSADGEAMVFHDHTLERLTEASGPVLALRASDLAALPLKGSATADMPQRLSDLVAQVGQKTPLVIEIKSRFDGDLRLARRVVETLAGAPANIAVKSFDPRVIAALRMLMPERLRGIVAMGAYPYPDFNSIPDDEKRAMAHLLHFTETAPDFISWHIHDLPHAAPHLCRVGLGLPVMGWTVRNAEDAARACPNLDQIVFEGFSPAQTG